MTPVDPDEFRAESREGWERAASDWGRVADRQREWGAELSATMVDALALQPGDRVLELAAGPGDTGFMAAELVQPGGTLISSDGAEAMLEVARERAAAQGVRGVEFKPLDLEWIDLPTAGVDAVLCRWGIMLVHDPEAAAREIRRVLRPGGRAALAVWDAPERNPWTTIPVAALRAQPGVPAPDPGAPNMFSLAADGALAELLEGAGFLEVTVRAIAMVRRVDSAEQWLEETLDISATRRDAFEALDDAAREAVREQIAAQATPFTDEDGSLVLPGSSLVAVATA